MAKKSKVISNSRKLGTVQYRNRCNLCSRPRGYLKLFGICRICFRKLAGEGLIPGIKKASW